MNLQDMFDNNSAHKFYSPSKETCAKLSVSLKGKNKGKKHKPFSIESRNKMSMSKKGKIRTEEHKNNISLAKMKLIHTPQGQFLGAKEAAWALNVHTRSIQNWLKSKPTEFYYIKEECQK